VPSPRRSSAPPPLPPPTHTTPSRVRPPPQPAPDQSAVHPPLSPPPLPPCTVCVRRRNRRPINQLSIPSARLTPCWPPHGHRQPAQGSRHLLPSTSAPWKPRIVPGPGPAATRSQCCPPCQATGGRWTATIAQVDRSAQVSRGHFRLQRGFPRHRAGQRAHQCGLRVTLPPLAARHEQPAPGAPSTRPRLPEIAKPPGLGSAHLAALRRHVGPTEHLGHCGLSGGSAGTCEAAPGRGYLRVRTRLLRKRVV
jgi:hypothetical protein